MAQFQVSTPKEKVFQLINLIIAIKLLLKFAPKINHKIYTKHI